MQFQSSQKSRPVFPLVRRSLFHRHRCRTTRYIILIENHFFVKIYGVQNPFLIFHHRSFHPRIESDLINSSLSNLKLIHISLKLNFKDTFATIKDTAVIRRRDLMGLMGLNGSKLIQI